MTTLVFPGQGSQYLKMTKDFYDNFQTAKNIFELVEDCTKIKVKEISQDTLKLQVLEDLLDNEIFRIEGLMIARQDDALFNDNKLVTNRFGSTE